MTNCSEFSVSVLAKILEEVIAYAKCFSQNIGHNFTSRNILLTALTGTAAVEIGGATSASTFKYLRKKTHATQADIDSFIDVRICVMDECSFAGYEQVLEKVSANLQNFTQCRDYQYGMVAFVFMGDFCQLETISGDCFYMHPDGVYWEQELNCKVELQGSHRFKNCNHMGNICSSIRNGILSQEYRAMLNSRVIGQNGVEMPDPTSTHFATYCNSLRCKINAEVFKFYLTKYHSQCTETNICRSAIVIKAHAHWPDSGDNLTFEQRQILFEEISEADTKSKNKSRCDPFLCLSDGANLMVDNNIDVANGIANGTNCLFRFAKLKPGANLEPIKIHGYWVNSVSVRDVEYLQLEWQNSARFKGLFRVCPKKGIYVIRFPIKEQGKKYKLKMNIGLEQFPVSINFATTGHKLQGKSLLSLAIAEWSKLKNWAYVVISRVCTLLGLFLLKPIPDDIDFTPAKQYIDMMERFRVKILANAEDVVDLKSTYNCYNNN